ncbi:MAG: HAMP domain-containing histidine kinase [Lachnospiraceae bacterium]|nr:HAMP domain-containing histidine kinase [Lachnospiraceae bacterium]
MDTKWKKWKQAGSLAAFLLGLYLLFFGLMSGGWQVVGQVFNGEGLSAVEEKLEADYQNTEKFRWYISDQLEKLLVVASGGQLDYYGTENYYYYGDGYYQDIEVTTEAQAQEECESDDWAWFHDWDEWYDQDMWFDWFWGAGDTSVAYTTEEPLMAQEWDLGISEEEAGEDPKAPTREELQDRYMEIMGRDKNLLYQVSYDGELLYTNAEGLLLSWEGRQLPEGYNFLLYFDGERVQIYKDGQDLEIYGNPYYEGMGEQWFVPGYQNFYLDEAAEKARIVMAVASQPRLYVQGNYGDTGSSQYGNSLYWMARNQTWRREEFQKTMARLFLGVALVILSVIFRKQKKTADQRVAKITGKCWLELKILLAILVFYPPRQMRVIWYGETGGMRLLALADALLLYLLINDLWQNRRRQRSLLRDLGKLLLCQELRLPVQKRMVKRLFVALAVGIVGILFLLVGLWLAMFVWDMDVQAGFFVGLAMVLLTLDVFLLARSFIYNKHNAEDIGALGSQIEAVRGGNLTEGLKIPKEHDLYQMAEQLNDIQRGLYQAMDEQMKSERMKVELISNVSHDIKTPLTSIISYVELLKEEENLPEHVKDYIEILGQKSERLKAMVQDVFEVSKASSGQLPVFMEQLDLQRLICQTLADMDEQIQGSGMTVKTDLPAGEVLIYADGRRLYRVFQNLILNALKYSLPGSRIHITLRQEGETARARIQNVSRVELDGSVDFTERFVRGDESRTDGGSGLGLSIARSFTEACQGSFVIRINADLFTAEVSFPIYRGGFQEDKPLETEPE